MKFVNGTVVLMSEISFDDSRATIKFSVWSKCLDVSITENDGFGESITLEPDHRRALLEQLLEAEAAAVALTESDCCDTFTSGDAWCELTKKPSRNISASHLDLNLGAEYLTDWCLCVRAALREKRRREAANA